MDVKTAVEEAKRYATFLFGEESIQNLGLEEVEFDEARDAWRVTVGFTRPWDHATGALSSLVPGPSRRTYKIIEIDNSGGRAVSIRNREPGAREVGS